MKMGCKAIMHIGTKVVHKFGGMTMKLEDESDRKGREWYSSMTGAL